MATMTSEERLEEFKKVYQENDVTLKGADIGVVMAYFVIIIGIGVFVSKLYRHSVSLMNHPIFCVGSLSPIIGNVQKVAKGKTQGIDLGNTICIDRSLYAI